MTLESIADFFRSLWGLWGILVFLGIVFYAFRPKNKSRLEDYGNIPLRDDDDKER